MALFTPRLDALPDAQRRLWPALKSATELGFVLYGGTAISLRLGHRLSMDFDFFTDRSLDQQALRLGVPWLSHAAVLQDAPDTLTVQVAGDSLDADDELVKVSFFGAITFGRLADPDMTADGVAQVASAEDLLATKLKALLQRVEAKDYLDIAALLDSGARLDRGLAGAKALYGPAFQPSECLKALVYFHGGDLETLAGETRTALIHAAAAVGPLPPVTIVSPTLSLPMPPSNAS